MALDLVAYNIRVNAVAPGLIRTDAMLAGFTNPVLLDEVQKHIPGGRFGESEEIANVILFLASDLASYITGEVVDVSHGLGAREAGPASQR
jgi:3-oxoacyl-[acyl-carrier protein] reductase